MLSDDDVRQILAEARRQGSVTLANVGQKLRYDPATTHAQRVIIRDTLSNELREKLQKQFATALKRGDNAALADSLKKEFKSNSKALDDIILEALQAALREMNN